MKTLMSAALLLAGTALTACAGGPTEGALGAGPAEPPVFQESRAPARPETLFLEVEGSFAEADARLRRALDGRALTIFAVVDHAENAREAGLSLAPTKLYVFGNPKAGTPFIAADARMGVELPMRMAISERDGQVRVTWPDMAGLARAYGITEAEAPVANVTDNMRRLAEDVAFAPEMGS